MNGSSTHLQSKRPMLTHPIGLAFVSRTLAAVLVRLVGRVGNEGAVVRGHRLDRPADRCRGVYSFARGCVEDGAAFDRSFNRKKNDSLLKYPLSLSAICQYGFIEGESCRHYSLPGEFVNKTRGEYVVDAFSCYTNCNQRTLVDELVKNAREKALLFESFSPSVALFFMAMAREFCPEGPFINKKVGGYMMEVEGVRI